MRKDLDRQLKLDVPSLDHIDFDPRSRHELEAILMALKHLYDSPQAMRSVLRLIADDVGAPTSDVRGWRIGKFWFWPPSAWALIWITMPWRI